VPVVATAAGGVPEVITHGKTGLTYPVGNITALASCLARLAQDDAFRLRLVRAGQAYARERYDRTAHLKRLEQLFHALTRTKDRA
jgi:glycosyltransferase involved in cell wall biosynthesis